MEILLWAEGEGKRFVCNVLGDTDLEIECSLDLEDGVHSMVNYSFGNWPGVVFLLGQF